MRGWMTLLTLFLLSFGAQAKEPVELLAEADRAFQSGEYEAAAKAYTQLVESGFESPDLFFNLGTSELRAGRRGAGILWFERALRLDPHDGDVLHNLAEARRGNIDKVVGTREEIPFVERVGERVPLELTTIVFAFCWLAGFLLLIASRFLSGRRGGLALGGIGSLFVALVSALLLWTVWVQRTGARHAVVVQASASVREGPAADFRSAFEIHEGLKVRVVREEQGFLRVRLPNGAEGWVSASEVPVI